MQEIHVHDNYTVSFMTPLGYGSETEETGATVAGGAVSFVDFSLSCVDIIPNAKTIGFWKHQVGVATGGKGKAHVDGATLWSYLDLKERPLDGERPLQFAN